MKPNRLTPTDATPIKGQMSFGGVMRDGQEWIEPETKPEASP